MEKKEKSVNTEAETTKKEINVKKKGGNFWLIAGVIVGIFILALTLYTVLGRSNNTYSDGVLECLTPNVGSFRYTIEVNTGAGTGESATISVNTEDSGLTVEEDTTETNVEATSTVSEWSDASGVSLADWTYPCFKFTVQGNVNSLEPLSMCYTVLVATPYENDIFTEVIVSDGMYYINTSKLRNWMLNSCDEGLIEVANSIPETQTYLTISESEFKIYSQFAEEYEKEGSAITSGSNYYNRILYLLSTVNGLVESDLNDCSSEVSGAISVAVMGDSSTSLIQSLKKGAINCGSYYTSYLDNLHERGLMDDSQYTIGIEEKDNFLTYMQNKWIWYNTLTSEDVSSLNLSLVGTSGDYEILATSSTPKTTSKEFTLGLSYTLDSTNYSVNVTGESMQDVTNLDYDLAVPTTSTYSYTEWGIENSENVCNALKEYFDVFELFTDVELLKSTTVVNESSIESLVSELNSACISLEGYSRVEVEDLPDLVEHLYNSELTMDWEINSKELVDDYMNNLSSSLGIDVANLINSEINGGAGGDVSEESNSRFLALDVTKNVEGTYTPDGSDISATVDGFYTIHAEVNTNESKTNLAVIDLTLMNMSDFPITFDFTKYYFQDIEGNKYPCNYADILSEFSGVIDLSTMVTDLTLNKNEFRILKLYVPMANGWSYFDLFDSDGKLGNIVMY